MAVQVNNDMQQFHLDLLQNLPFRIEDVLSLSVANDFHKRRISVVPTVWFRTRVSGVSP